MARRLSWNFNLQADPAVLAIEEFGLTPMKIDEWNVAGSITPQDGRVTISRFVIRSGSASIELAGSMVDTPGAEEVRVAGVISPMSVDVLKRLWPKFLAGKARAWVLERVAGGEVMGGKFTVNLGPADIAKLGTGGELPAETLNVELNLSGMSIVYVVGTAAGADQAGQTDGDRHGVRRRYPRGEDRRPVGRRNRVQGQGRFFIPDLRVDPQQGEITYTAAGATPTVLELLDHEPLGYLRTVGMKPDFLGGTAEGSFTLNLPLLSNLEFNQIKLKGAARLNDAVASSLVGNADVSGGTLDVNVTEQAVEAKGGINIKGVPAELSWQRIFYTPDDRQPPIKVTARLDAPMREKLGIKVNHLLRGPTPITLEIARLGEGAASPMHVQADLTEAQLLFNGLGWTKPAGRAATLMLDVVPRPDGATDLANLKILGDEINIQGGVALDPAQRLKEFYFSDFSVNRLTHVEITATVRDDQVLDIKAEGPSFDGKQFFQSLFSAGQLDGSAEPAEPFGVDLTAEIGTVTGFYDTTVKDVTVSMKKRNGRIVALDAKGELNGRAPVAVHLAQSGSARIINAEARDAGDAFRVIGFYPSVKGGEASLEVNLDAGGADNKSGTLWARQFIVLGDSVVNDVLTDPDFAAVLGDRKQQVSRQQLAFNQLRAPFTVGGGKFRLKDAYMNGPMLGATMRGMVDFKAQTVDLGGTYVPALWLELGARLDSDSRQGSGRQARRGRGRHHLRHQRQARRAHRARQSDVGDDAGHLQADLRVHRLGAGSGLSPPPASPSSFMEPGAHYGAAQQ